MIRKAIVTWLLMIPIAILNGGLRETLVKPHVGDLAAHQISVVTGSLGFFALVYIMLRHEVPAKADRWLLGLGSVWVMATVIFEFIFGHFVMGHSWSRLLADYNILQGRLWTVVLAVVAVAPLAVKRIVTRRHGSARTVDQEHAATV